MRAAKLRKQYFDEDLAEDVQATLDAAAQLGIAEFRMFHIAYRQWYGCEADEKTIERYFIQYMFHDTVPFWVRHFSQRVRDLDRRGRLDPAEFGIARPKATTRQINRGRVFALGLVTAMVTLVLLAELAADKTCLFPPCY